MIEAPSRKVGLDVEFASERWLARLRRVERLIDEHFECVFVGELDDRRAKAACEIVLLCSHLARVAPDVDRAWREKIVAALAPRLRSTTVLQRWLWRPAQAAAFGLGHTLLTRAGYAAPEWDRALERVLSLDASRAREASPYERLEENWCRAMLGRERFEPTGELAALEREVHPLFMSENDAYALTHTVLYATDLGRRALGETERRGAHDALEAGIAWSLVRRDFDLLGEMLLGLAAVSDSASPNARFGIAALVATWDVRGTLPDRAASASRRDSNDARVEAFFGCYHAQLVGALLAASMLAKPEWARAASPSVDDATPALAERMLEALLGAQEWSLVRSWLGSANASLAAELLIQHGMERRDLDIVLAGVRMGSTTSPRSSTWRAARRWLETFGGCLEELRWLERPGGKELAATIASAMT